MTVPRAMGVLAGILVIMVAVVLVRAETARLENDQARLERQEASLRLEAREQEIEIARLRNPVLLRARVSEMWNLDEKPSKAAGAKGAAKADAPLPKRTGGRTTNSKPPADATNAKPAAKRGG